MPDATVVKIRFADGAEETFKRLSAYPKEMIAAVARGMDRAAQLVLGRVTVERFTGKGPFPVAQGKLGVRTNRLRSSLRTSRAEIKGGNVRASIGSNVEYMGAHEFGFSGSVTVKAHQRRAPQRDRFDVNGQAVSRKTGRELLAIGARGRQLQSSTIDRRLSSLQTASGIARVKSHKRKMDIPARAPLRKGIEDHREIVTHEILTECRKAWEGKAEA